MPRTSFPGHNCANGLFAVQQQLMELLIGQQRGLQERQYELAAKENLEDMIEVLCDQTIGTEKRTWSDYQRLTCQHLTENN